MLPTDNWRCNGTWTRYTAAHFLAKALLYRQSERCNDWNSKYPAKTDLDRVIALCDEVIKACPLANDYNQLYAEWTGVDCANEGLSEILMTAEHNDDSSTQGRFGNRTYNYFLSFLIFLVVGFKEDNTSVVWTSSVVVRQSILIQSLIM